MKREGWETVAIVAAGPSLTEQQAETVRRAHRDGRCKLIVINSMWPRFPDADILYSADGAFWKKYIAEIRAGFRGELWTQDHKASTDHGLRWVECVPGAGLHLDSTKIYAGANGGHQCIAIAVQLFASRRVLLVAYDMKFGPNGAKHSHEDHPHPLSNGNPSGWIKHFNTLAPQLVAAGVECINCSVDTALECFPRMTLEEALCVTEA